MIFKNSDIIETHLHVVKRPNGEFKIAAGTIDEPRNFRADKTILITPTNPGLLWNLLYDLMQIPLPPLEPLIKAPKPKPVESGIKPIESDPSSDNSLEQDLLKLTGREIIEKVKNEKGVTITITPKSKAAIIRKALQIYSK